MNAAKPIRHGVMPVRAGTHPPSWSVKADHPRLCRRGTQESRGSSAFAEDDDTTFIMAGLGPAIRA
jgi:hypothetical protein